MDRVQLLRERLQVDRVVPRLDIEQDRRLRNHLLLRLLLLRILRLLRLQRCLLLLSRLAEQVDVLLVRGSGRRRRHSSLRRRGRRSLLLSSGRRRRRLHRGGGHAQLRRSNAHRRAPRLALGLGVRRHVLHPSVQVRMVRAEQVVEQLHVLRRRFRAAQEQLAAQLRLQLGGLLAHVLQRHVGLHGVGGRSGMIRGWSREEKELGKRKDKGVWTA
ncbi:translation elongation factor 1-beta, putative [Leishmania tarentolae]|uniref:Translation elongation factor 1-beta, putative n=1 Tax=Leishmania tarentolae TaxID=5689 RepID=A0A640KST2_LEITA|nr:translation elongation factor 1-beta, putative [Leishmania tarentolae]